MHLPTPLLLSARMFLRKIDLLLLALSLRNFSQFSYDNFEQGLEVVYKIRLRSVLGYTDMRQNQVPFVLLHSLNRIYAALKKGRAQLY